LPAGAVESDLGCTNRATKGLRNFVELHFRKIMEQHNPPAVKRQLPHGVEQAIVRPVSVSRELRIGSRLCWCQSIENRGDGKRVARCSPPNGAGGLAAHVVSPDVARDAPCPCAQRRSAAKLRQRAEHVHQRLLGKVLGKSSVPAAPAGEKTDKVVAQPFEGFEVQLGRPARAGIGAGWHMQKLLHS
jgi:hypothetical protein